MKSYAADQEAWTTLATPTAGGSGVYLRVQNPNTVSANGYACQYHVGVGWRLFKVVAGVATQIGSTDATVAAAGDGLWGFAEGTTIGLYHFTGGKWVQRVLVTGEGSVVGAGQIGAVIGDATGRLGLFGGGAVGGNIGGGIARVIASRIAPQVGGR